MAKKIFEFDIYRHNLETYIFGELMELTPYLNTPEKQKIAITLTHKFCDEWKAELEEAVKTYNELKTGSNKDG